MRINKILLSVASVLVIVVGMAILFFLKLMSPIDDVGEFDKFRPSQSEQQTENAVRVSFYGVSTLAIDDGKTTVLIDSFFSRPGPFDVLFSELQSKEDEVLEGLQSINAESAKAIFVVHSHYDHALDLNAVYKITNSDIYGSESSLNIARGGNVPEDKLHLIEGAYVTEVGDFTITVIRSKHSVPPNAESDQESASIDKPMQQPATNADFAMGGNFDFLIEHPKASILVKGSANYVPSALKGLDVDALFIGSAQLGMQSTQFQKAFIEESIEAVSPEIIVPLHWDNFVTPWRKGSLEFNPQIVDDAPAKGLKLLSGYAKENNATFYLLQSSDTLWVRKST